MVHSCGTMLQFAVSLLQAYTVLSAVGCAKVNLRNSSEAASVFMYVLRKFCTDSKFHDYKIPLTTSLNWPLSTWNKCLTLLLHLVHFFDVRPLFPLLFYACVSSGQPRQLRARDLLAARPRLNAQTFDTTDLDNDGRPSWLLKEVGAGNVTYVIKAQHEVEIGIFRVLHLLLNYNWLNRRLRATVKDVQYILWLWQTIWRRSLTLFLLKSILGMLIFDDFKVDTEGGEWDVFNDDLLCAFGRSAADGLPFGQVRA